MEKLNVLQVNKLYYPSTGGIERVAQQLAEGLKDKVNMRVLVCNTKNENETVAVNGVNVHRASSFKMLGNMPLSITFMRELTRLSKNCDVIHFHLPFPLGDLGCLLSGYKGKVVVWWHSDVVRQKKMMHFYRPIMERFLKRADVIIVATQGHIDGSEYLKPYQNKCVVIPYGVEPSIEAQADEWIRKRDTKELEEKSNSVRDKKVRFMFAGRLVYYKGCKVLLDAFHKVKGAELVIVGSGPMEEEMKQQVQDSGSEDSVHFLGGISDEELKLQFAACDVFVLPSIVRSEAFGLVQIEAMAYEKPVINTNLPSGVPYVSIHGKTGLTVEPEDVEGLANAMQWMVDNPREREEMGIAGRKRVKEEFQMKKMIDSTLQLYQEITKPMNK